MKHYVWYVRGIAHRDMAAVSIAAARKAEPSANFIVVCDDGTDMKPLAKLATPWLLAVNSLPIMLANLVAHCTVLMETPVDDEVWFIDTDTLLLKPMPTMHHDLTVTYREYVRKTDDGVPVIGVAQQMPYNYGVVGARAGGAAREAFLWLRERIAGYNMQYQQWYGNQLALAQLVGPAIQPPKVKAAVTRGIPWRGEQLPISTVSIDQWPCDFFNYTPEKSDEYIAGKYLLHFKGHSRHLMSDYAMKLGFIDHLVPMAPPMTDTNAEQAA